MATKLMLDKPIPIKEDFSWEKVKEQKIKNSDQKLISLNMIPEKIVVSPQYFIQGIEGALPECFIREGAYDNLLNAAENLPQGYKFLVYDAWRPERVQYELFDRFKKEIKTNNPDITEEKLNHKVEEYVALPSHDSYSPSPHLTGGAVDLTIIDDKGKPLNMGSGFDETKAETHTDYFEMLNNKKELSITEKSILKNRRLLYNIMIDANFTNYPHEWWHYDFGNQVWAFMGQREYAIYSLTEPNLRWKHKY
ncbi:MAG TPA: M15 family metallopeptidase [Halanaerobiales bacterium]|nr:M15 family metallopeptidase [Halanaerobiales bacterium]